MQKILQVAIVAVVGLCLGLAVVGCGPSSPTGKDKMKGDKMNDKMGDKMGGDKMNDKMGENMKGDKMADKMGDKMQGEKKDK
jgi:hypothetical protein